MKQTRNILKYRILRKAVYIASIFVFVSIFFLNLPNKALGAVIYDSSNIGQEYNVSSYVFINNLYMRFPYATSSYPYFPTDSFLTITAPIETLRVKRISGVACNVPSNVGLIKDSGNSLSVYTGVAHGDFCDFRVMNTNIGDKFMGIALCVNGYCDGRDGDFVLDGSDTNAGYSFNGNGQNPTPGGVAFQLCDIDGCSGGFNNPTPPPPPPEPLCTENCNSNVMFLPGFEGSHLYRKQFLENELWVPNRNDDVKKLSLDSNGVPVDPTIYTRDVIDRSFGIDVYRKFLDSMNGLVASSTIAGFKSLPYDWRLNLDSIVDNPVALEDGGSYSMIDELEKMASTSRTSKVTIVAHSNGGLVAKKLIQKLEAMGKANLVDKLILVAVPQLGTPKAVTALLHGYDSSIGRGFFLNSSVARTFGENMPGAYNLLPSDEYFNQVVDPVIVFDSSIDGLSNLRTIYGNSINTKSSFYDFLLATRDGRTKPIESNLKDPNILRSNLLSDATTTHSQIDTWIPPASIKVSQIAGWGIDTVKGVKYVKAEEIICVDRGVCNNVAYLDYEPLFTQDGDNTVVTSSAVLNQSDSYYLNLFETNKSLKENRKHMDVMESKPLQDFITNIILGNTIILDGIKKVKPIPDEADRRLKIAIHSPVSVDIYDDLGNHTGLINNPDINSDLQLFEENVPNSYYLQFGEGKYVGGDLTNINTVKLSGTGSGTFTINTSVVTSSTTTNSNFVDIPVTPLMTGEFSVSATTSVAQLSLDVDGDGIKDFIVVPNNSFDPILYLQVMRKTVLTFELKPAIEKQFLQKIDKLIKLIQDGRIKKAAENMKKYIKRIESGKIRKIKKLDDTEKQTLLNMLNTLLDNIK